MQQKLRNAIEAIHGHKIPEIPREILMLEDELQAKFPNIVNVAKIIEKNTTLSGEVIKLINSPVMKLKLVEPIQSIRDAVNVLGLDNIYNLIVASAIRRLFPQSGLIQDIMNHSVDVAFCMAELSEYVQGISRDEAYMLGLFHNSGALMLASMGEEKYESLYSSSLSLPLSVLKKEEEVYRTNHAMVGVLVTQKWHLPVNMINAVLLHHNQKCANIKNDQVRLMVGMLKIANAIVAEISLGAYCGGEARQYEQDGEHELMIESDDIKEIRKTLMTYSYK